MDTSETKDKLTAADRLKESLEQSARFNPSDMEKPCAVLWTDQDKQWEPIISKLQSLMPDLLVLGDYELSRKTGPAIWLRAVVDGMMPEVETSENVTPILYLPGVSRQELRAVQECPDRLKPLVELQYRGLCWTQKNGKDWTVEAFLVSEEGGLGLDIAKDAHTRRSVLNSLDELALTPVGKLKDRHLEADDFGRLFFEDLIKAMLLWMNDPAGIKSEWTADKWNAFKTICAEDYKLDPDKDGDLVGAELLSEKGGTWSKVWERFAESPSLYPNIPTLLERVIVGDLLAIGETRPQSNDVQEDELREALLSLIDMEPGQAREKVRELEQEHGIRRDWAWSKLGKANLAQALKYLAEIAGLAKAGLGGSALSEVVKLYCETGWQIDDAALSTVAAVKSDADKKAVEKALRAVYCPWLEQTTEHFQSLVEKEPLPGHDKQSMDELLVELGGVVLFADGLRFDVAQRLLGKMQEKGWLTNLSIRWAGLPSVTATAKPAVSPVAVDIQGGKLNEDFLPETAEGGQSLKPDRFRKLLESMNYQFLSKHEEGDPSGRAWTENGELDKLGHKLQEDLASQIDTQVDLLLERIGSLLEAGWREVRVVTDHGWLWLPGGLPKAELPKYLTESRWARCAAIKGESKVEVPTVP